MKKLKKNILFGKNSLVVIFFLICFVNQTLALEKASNLEGQFIEIKILDRVSSKNSLLKLKILGY